MIRIYCIVSEVFMYKITNIVLIFYLYSILIDSIIAIHYIFFHIVFKPGLRVGLTVFQILIPVYMVFSVYL